MKGSKARTSAVVLVATAAFACTDSRTATDVASLEVVDASASARATYTVTVSPTADTLGAGASAQFTATVQDERGRVRPRTVTWRSSAPSIATVSTSGTVLAISPGSATISATDQSGAQGSASILVIPGATAPTPAPVASVTVSLGSPTLSISQTTQATAVARDASGNILTGRAVTWASSNPSVAAVTSTGVVTAVATGTASVVATSEGRSGSSTLTVSAPPSGGVAANECASPRAGWIFCDDFDVDRLSRYFEYWDMSGGFARAAGTGRDGSTAMRARFAQGQVEAGKLELAFGRTPSSYIRPVDAGTANYREVYWRFYVRTQSGWQGGAGWKLTRGIVFAGENWSQAAIGHLSGYWTEPWLTLYPTSGTDAAGNLRTTKYNDFANFRDIGFTAGTAPIFGTESSNQWHCVEAHMRLNDAGQANGIFEFWVNDALEARQTSLNWLGSYSAYGINAIFIENYNNEGAPQAQERYFDNFVVSTQRIGCS